MIKNTLYFLNHRDPTSGGGCKNIETSCRAFNWLKRFKASDGLVSPLTKTMVGRAYKVLKNTHCIESRPERFPQGNLEHSLIGDREGLDLVVWWPLDDNKIENQRRKNLGLVIYFLVDSLPAPNLPAEQKIITFGIRCCWFPSWLLHCLPSAHKPCFKLSSPALSLPLGPCSALPEKLPWWCEQTSTGELINWSTGLQRAWLLLESKLEPKSIIVWTKVSEAQRHNCHLAFSERWYLLRTLPNIATGETPQAITRFHCFHFFSVYHWKHFYG